MGTCDSTDWLNVSIPVMWYWYVARAHAASSAVHSSGDSYKTKNADDRKAKSREDTCAMNCEAGMRERPANLTSLLVLPSFMYASFFFAGHFTQTLFHTFLHKTQHVHTAFWTRLAHAWSIRAYTDSTLSFSHATPHHATTQLKLTPSDDTHLSSLYALGCD